jgi:hypothetical protein
MAASGTKPKTSMRTLVQMAIAALDCHPGPSPLDQDMSAVDPDPTSLDLVLPDNRDDRHATESGAARGGTKGRFLRRG